MLTFDTAEIAQGDFKLRADLVVEAGSFTAVIGPSGAGKSTLLGAAAGFVDLSAGRVLIDGQDVTGTAPGVRPVSIVFQDGNLFPHLTVIQNVGLGLRPSLKLSEAETAQAMDALARVGLSGLETRKPGALSGGQQSRVALARVLLRQAKLVLLDEPFAALGPALKIEMLELIASIKAEAGLTVMMITHDPQDAAAFADRAILVADGMAHPPVETRALLANPPDVLRAYLGT